MPPSQERPDEPPAADQPAPAPQTWPAQPAPETAVEPAPGASPQRAWPPQGGAREPAIAGSPRASHDDRNAIADQLRDAFADGRLDEEEFDVRIQSALSARTRDELLPLLADLGTAAPVLPTAGAPAQHARVAPVQAGGGPMHTLSVAVMGGVERRGRWRVPAQATALAIMGGVDLDLRAATLTSPVTTIRAVAIMGGIDIIVPPGVRVEMNGIPLMGGGDNRVDDAHLPLTAPLVKVQWIALMGGVSVRTKAPKSGKDSDGRELKPR